MATEKEQARSPGDRAARTPPKGHHQEIREKDKEHRAVDDQVSIKGGTLSLPRLDAGVGGAKVAVVGPVEQHAEHEEIAGAPHHLNDRLHINALSLGIDAPGDGRQRHSRIGGKVPGVIAPERTHNQGQQGQLKPQRPI